MRWKPKLRVEHGQTPHYTAVTDIWWRLGGGGREHQEAWNKLGISLKQTETEKIFGEASCCTMLFLIYKKKLLDCGLYEDEPLVVPTQKLRCFVPSSLHFQCAIRTDAIMEGESLTSGFTVNNSRYGFWVNSVSLSVLTLLSCSTHLV